MIQQISLNTRDPLLQEWKKILTPHLSIAEEEKILSRAKRAKANDPSKLETLLKQAQALSGTRKADFFLILLPIVSLNNPTDPKTKSFLNDYIHAAHENSYRLFEMSQRLLNIALDFAQRTDVSDSAIQLYVVSLLKIGIRLKLEDGVKLVHEALSALNFESRNQNKEYFVKRYVNHTLQTLPAAAVVQVLKLLSEHPLGKKPDLLEEYQQS
ncbi:MAG: hypothetical protein JNK65_02885 [Deltaproteobacteria bacterium]|nr:hypothetical protein [Deltaproteobacteria bacterium]